MKFNKKISLKYWLGLAIIFYLIASFINLSFNPLEWGGFSRACYAIGGLLTAFSKFTWSKLNDTYL